MFVNTELDIEDCNFKSELKLSKEEAVLNKLPQLIVPKRVQEYLDS